MLEALRTPLPEQVRDWARLPGLSDSLVAYLYNRLNIATLTDLEKLVRSHLLRTLPGFSGSDEALLQAIETLRLESRLSGRAELFKYLPSLKQLHRLLQLHVLLQ